MKGREGQAAEPLNDAEINTLLEGRFGVSSVTGLDDIAWITDQLNRLVALKAAQACGPSQPETEGEAGRQPVGPNSPSEQPSPSTPIVPSTPDDPRFNGVVEELIEEFAILDGDIPALMFIVGKLRQSVLEEAAQFIDDHYSDVDHPFAGDAFREKYAIADKRSS